MALTTAASLPGSAIGARPDVDTAIADVSRRLVARFSRLLPPHVIEATVRSCAARWQDVRVQEFVPLLVERRSTEVLRGLIARS